MKSNESKEAIAMQKIAEMNKLLEKIQAIKKDLESILKPEKKKAS